MLDMKCTVLGSIVAVYCVLYEVFYGQCFEAVCSVQCAVCSVQFSVCSV